jgi:glycosyltransferase involved in cell wall biosynthesis
MSGGDAVEELTARAAATPAPAMATAPTATAGATGSPTPARSLAWIYTDDLHTQLDAATWIEATRHLRRLGWAVTLISAAEGDTSEGVSEIVGVPLQSLRKPRLWLLGQLVFHLRVLALILRRRDTLDAVIFHEMSVLWLLPLRLLGSARPRLVMDTRTLFMAPPQGVGLKDRLRWLYGDLMRALGNRFADGRLCITAAMAEACAVPAEKLWGLWPSGVEPQRFAAPPDARSWPRGGEPIELIYVGALDPVRRLRALCSAVSAANAAQRRFRLTFVGGGSERQALMEIAAGSDGAIRVLAQVAHAEVPALLWGAHVGTLPFPDQQNLRVASPIKLFEYMAAGLPVLATRIRCHTDVLDDAEFAFWADTATPDALHAALEELWQRRAELPRLGALAAAQAPSWSWAAAASSLNEALVRGLRHAERREAVKGATIRRAR